LYMKLRDVKILCYPICEVSYAELKSGKIKIKGKDVPTASLPGVDAGMTFKPLKERPIEY